MKHLIHKWNDMVQNFTSKILVHEICNTHSKWKIHTWKLISYMKILESKHFNTWDTIFISEMACEIFARVVAFKIIAFMFKRLWKAEHQPYNYVILTFKNTCEPCLEIVNIFSLKGSRFHSLWSKNCNCSHRMKQFLVSNSWGAAISLSPLHCWLQFLTSVIKIAEGGLTNS